VGDNAGLPKPTARETAVTVTPLASATRAGTRDRNVMAGRNGDAEAEERDKNEFLAGVSSQEWCALADTKKSSQNCELTGVGNRFAFNRADVGSGRVADFGELHFESIPSQRTVPDG
jgi:hypothetical protein